MAPMLLIMENMVECTDTVIPLNCKTHMKVSRYGTITFYGIIDGIENEPKYMVIPRSSFSKFLMYTHYIKHKLKEKEKGELYILNNISVSFYGQFVSFYECQYHQETKKMKPLSGGLSFTLNAQQFAQVLCRKGEIVKAMRTEPPSTTIYKEEEHYKE